jgi:subtilisin-like proprotein convertase family protein
VPKSIPRNGSVTSNLTIGGSSEIKDLDVVNLTGNHASIGDIAFSLKSPANTNVTIMAQQSCSGNVNFNLNLDDEAANPIPCPPTGGGPYKPSNPLAAFDNQSANGTWVLTVNDNRPGNGGTLSTWGLNVCTASCSPAHAPSGLSAGKLNASTVGLNWDEAGAATYEVWYAPNQPYFDPAGKTCANPAPFACSVTSALNYDHAGLGSVGSSYAYVLRAGNGCGDVTATLSNRVGEFEFALTAGTN